VWLHPQESLEVLAMMWAQASGDAPKVSREHVGVLGNAVFYLRTFAFGGYPAVLVAPLAIFALLRGVPRDAAAVPWRLFAANLVVLIVFFLLVSKHFPWYVMPAYPFLSILVGGWLADLLRSDSPRAGLGIGAVLTTLLWIGIDFGANPFAERALVVPMQWTSREWLGLSPAVAIAAVGGAWALLWMLSGARIPGAWRRGIGIACAAVCVAYAGLRAVAPLAHLDHQSPLDRIHARVYADLAAGRPLDCPIRLGPAPPQIARFLFAADFEIVPRAGRDATRLVLHPRGDPRVLDRSIGRAGLEHRFAQARQPEPESAR
jgi:hypothetical protein